MGGFKGDLRVALGEGGWDETNRGGEGCMELSGETAARRKSADRNCTRVDSKLS